MKTIIWKFEFDITDNVVLDMPQGAEILSTQVQHGKACIWARVVPDNPRVKRKINIAGTGHDLSGRFMGNFIGTLQLYNGDLVFHVFDGLEE